MATTDLTAANRRRLAAEGVARPDGSYPIADQVDLTHAYEDYIRTGRPASVAAHIAKRAKALGLENPIHPDKETPAESGPRDERDAARRFIQNRHR